MAKLFNLARMSTATTGTGTITLDSAVSGFLTFAQSGVANSDVVSYGIRDGANSEVGTGTYTSSGTTLTRTVIKSTNSDTAINLSGTAEVYVTARAEDFYLIDNSNGGAYAITIQATVATDFIKINAGGGIDFFNGATLVARIQQNCAEFGTHLLKWHGSGPGFGGDTGLTRNAAGVLEVNNGTAGTLRDLKLRDITLIPSASLTPANNGDLVVEATSNTSLTFKYKGSDGTVRSASLTLA